VAKLKGGTRIYGTATVDTSVTVGSGVTITSSGIQVVGSVSASNVGMEPQTHHNLYTFKETQELLEHFLLVI
jgi:hypothetical protein